MKIDALSNLIIQKYGVIKRARGAFLYTAGNKTSPDGVRLADLYLAGGKAILGWHQGASYTAFKNAFNRGAIGNYGTKCCKEIEMAVNSLFAHSALTLKEKKTRRVYVFTDKAKAFKTAYTLSKDSTMFWRPWGGDWSGATEKERQEMENSMDADCIIFVPPFPWGAPIYLLAAKSGLDLIGTAEGDDIPSPLAAAVSRSIYTLKAQLPLRSEKDWFAHDKVLSRWWRRRGPYLYIKQEAVSKEGYDGFVIKCLDCAVLISPDYNTPSIITPDLDGGVFKKLRALP